MAHGGHDAKISATAAQCPKQLLFIIAIGDDDPPVREDDLCGEQIVQRQSGAADQWPVAAAQREPGHAYSAACARHSRDVKRIRYCSHVGSARASRNYCVTVTGIDGHLLHVAEIDDDA